MLVFVPELKLFHFVDMIPIPLWRDPYLGDKIIRNGNAVFKRCMTWLVESREYNSLV
jgi:hypothetical protein